jgi:energy-converting hydrogenase A subunit D
VAFLTAMLDPLSIIVFLIALTKIYNVRKSKMEDYSTIDNLEIIKENDGELNERPFKEAR